MTTGIEKPGARRRTAAGNASGATSHTRAPASERAAPGGRSPVTTAILVATAGAAVPAAAQEFEGVAIVRRLIDQLAGLGVHTAHVIARPDATGVLGPPVDGAAATVRIHACGSPADDLRAVATVAREADGAVVVMYADIVAHREALAGLLAIPRIPTGILTAWRRRPFTQPVRAARGRVMSAGSPYHSVHRPTTSFYGVLKVSNDDRAALADVAERFAGALDGPLPPEWYAEIARKPDRWRAVLGGNGDEQDDDEPAVPPADVDAEVERRLRVAREDVVSPLVVGLVRADVRVGAVQLRGLFWARPLTPAQLARAAETIKSRDEDRTLLDASVKASDGFFTTYFVSSYSKYIARWAARRGLTPNMVTSISMAIGIAAAAAFATGERAGLVAGAVLAYFAFVTDCVDGQLARYTRTFSKLGAWLDSVFDRAKEYAVYAGLAIGAAQAGDDVWVLAAAALSLQTARHAMDFSFESIKQLDIEVEQPPLEQSADAARQRALARAAERAPEPVPAPPKRSSRPRRLLAVWRALDETPALLWLKKIAVFPIGERFAVIAITAALFTPRTTFTVMLAWGGFAAIYAFGGRFLRSVAR